MASSPKSKTQRKRSKKGDRIFTTFKRKLQRKEFTRGEAITGIIIILCVAGATAWIAAQEDNFDPGERDIETSLLIEQSTKDDLYRTPFKRWRDPAQAAAGGPVAVDTGPLPASILSGGWTVGRIQTFTPDTLYEKINGQAEQYTKYGFKKLTFIPLSLGEVSIDVYLYDQGTFLNALGIYAAQRADKPVAERDGVLFTAHTAGAIGLVGRVFFHLTGTKKDDPAILKKSQELVGALAKLQSGGGLPLAFKALRNTLELPFASISYEPENVFQYEYANEFWFANLPQVKDARYFVHLAGSTEAAATLVTKLTASLQEDDYVLQAAAKGGDEGGGEGGYGEEGGAPTTPPRVFQHPVLKSFFVLSQRDRLVFGIENHPKRAAAEAAAEALGEALHP